MLESQQLPRHDSFTASLPDPFQILGLKLKPLSLGRYRVLRRLDNAFVSDTGATCDIADLLLAIIVCAHRVDEFMDLLHTGKLPSIIQQWSRKICPFPIVAVIPLVGKWWRTRYAFNLLEKVGLFRRYIEHHTQMPRYWDLTEDHAASGTHWSHALEITLRSNLSWTDEEINESPLSKALSDYLGYAESQNCIKLMTEEEIEMESLGQRNAEILARN